jgi:hypothetical protein
VIWFLFIAILQSGRVAGGSRYSTPYDSTQGVPGYVFVGFWVIILLFLIRLAWEFRDKIFIRKPTDIEKK